MIFTYWQDTRYVFYVFRRCAYVNPKHPEVCIMFFMYAYIMSEVKDTTLSQNDHFTLVITSQKGGVEGIGKTL